MKLFTVFISCGFLVVYGSERRIETRSGAELAAEKTAAQAPKGPEIFGLFVGRTPCQELSQTLNAAARAECNKVKCRLILYRDAVTRRPTSFSWKGKVKGEGKWWVEETSSRTIYKLQMGETTLSLLKVDENVLYILSREGEPLVGNSDFSYTLNRVIPIP